MFGKSEYKEAASATAFFGIGLGVWAIIVVALVLFLSVVGLGFEKYRQNKLTEINRQTNQYVTTQQTMLNTWANQYRENEIRSAEATDPQLKAAIFAQNSVMCDQMRMAAGRIDPQYIPKDAQIIISGGCQ